MPIKINRLNIKYGKLLVIGKADSKRIKDGNSAVYWLCKCDCGNTVEVSSSCLGSKRPTRSCGCLQKEAVRLTGKSCFKGVGVAGTNSLYTRYRRGAQYRNLEFSLTKEEFKKLLFESCYYCKDGLKSIWRRSEVNQKLEYNGIDRVDPKMGYVLNNVVTCCKDCNIAKTDFTKEEFFSIVKKIYEEHLV